MAITYATLADTGTTNVNLDGKLVGKITETRKGFRYHPKGAKTPSEFFPTLDAMKRSLEGPESHPAICPKCDEPTYTTEDGVLHEDSGKEECEPQKILVGTIDLTPAGCQTPEGNTKVMDALSLFEDASANVANLTAQWLDFHCFTVLPEGMEDFKELCEAVADRAKRQEEFLRALAGK